MSFNKPAHDQDDSDSEPPEDEPMTPRLGKSHQYRAQNAVFSALWVYLLLGSIFPVADFLT